MAVRNAIHLHTVLLLLFLQIMTSHSLSASTSHEIVSQCACGSARLAITVNTATKPVVAKVAAADNIHSDVDQPEKDDDSVCTVDCHCRACRKYHVSAFTSYLVLSEKKVHIPAEASDNIRIYRDSCVELGEVERLACRKCHTKLATRPIHASIENDANDETTGTSTSSDVDLKDDKILVNMGSLVDSTIPDKLAFSWRSQRTPWLKSMSQQASWLHAQPEFDEDDENSQEPLVMTGGCACGQHRYRINYQPPQELQHCYCKLCRQLSGGPFMTWIPVYNEDIEWMTESNNSAESTTKSTTATTRIVPQGEPPLVRTTEHGQRHICTSCGGVLTIVYDDQPDMTWPAAGSLDDAAIPTDVALISKTLCNVMHICCRYRQMWYQLPRDGLPRVPEAC
jgi:hypothetical protein